MSLKETIGTKFQFLPEIIYQRPGQVQHTHTVHTPGGEIAAFHPNFLEKPKPNDSNLTSTAKNRLYFREY